MKRWSRRGLAGALALAGALPACSSDSPEVLTVTASDAYVAAVNWYVQSVPAPPDTTDTEPIVIYIASASSNEIGPQAQADVAADLADRKDQVVVRFADVPDDALKSDTEGKPVKDDGVLLLVGDVVEGSPPVDVEVEVYRNEDEDQQFVMRIVRAGKDDFGVTAVTQLEAS